MILPHVRVTPRRYGADMIKNDPLTCALTLLEALGAEIVDACPAPDCSVCAPLLDVAA